MGNFLGVLALMTLLVALGAHVVLVRALAQRLRRLEPRPPIARVVLAALFPPLAVLDGLGGGARRQAQALVAAALVHAVVVAVARAVLG